MRYLARGMPFVVVGLFVFGCGDANHEAAEAAMAEKEVVLKVPGMT